MCVEYVCTWLLAEEEEKRSEQAKVKVCRYVCIFMCVCVCVLHMYLVGHEK